MEQVSFIFSSDNLELKSEGENFFVEGYISTSDLDMVNDIVTQKCLLDMADQMKKRTIKFDVEHESFLGKSNLEREVNKTIIPAAKIDDFLMDKKGLKVRAMLNKHSRRFDEVKGSIEEEFLDAFSIAFIPIEAKKEFRDGKEVRLLDKINLLNVAFTGNPINTESKMTNVFAKSLKFLEEQEKAKAPKRPKPKVSESEYEDDEEEDEKKKKKKKEEGKDNNHESDIIKLQEVKDMGEEEEKETTETPEESEKEEESTESETTEPETKPEGEEPKEGEEEGSEGTEVKAITEKVEAMEKELAEVKALLKKPLRKSKVEQKDQSENFVEEKSKDPLDLIA